MDTYKLKSALIMATAAAVVVTTVHAEEAGALGMKLGSGGRLLLSLDSALVHFDNYYYTPGNEESALGLVVKPLATISYDRGELRYSASAGAEAAAFDLDGDEDDYIDTLINGKFEWNPLTRHLLKGQITRRDDHDPFGTRRTEGTASSSADFDEWSETEVGLGYRFGAPQAKLNFEAEVSTTDRSYDTNRAFTQFLDYEVDTLRGAVIYNLSSKTMLLAEIIDSSIDYDEETGFTPREGDLTRYRVGGIWQATGNTEGDIRLGKVERDFDSNLQSGYDEFDWQVGVTWSPRARDVIRLATGRTPEESYVNGASIIDNRHATLSWSHDWTALLKSKVSYGFNDLDFRGIARKDELQSITLGAVYQAARNWSVYGDLALNERDSDVSARDYDSRIITAGIRLDY